MLRASFLPLSVLVRTRAQGSQLFGWVAAAVLVVGLAAPAGAQQRRGEELSLFAPYIGVTTGGDTNTQGATFGFSTAYVDETNWGGEFDIAHSTSFNDQFQSSGLTTMMLNVMFAPRATKQLRPFVLGGAGLIRVRGCTENCVREVSETDFGLDAGGGAMWSLSDAWGLRGDVRYFRYVNTNRDVPRLNNGPFDFWRVTIGGTYTW